MLSERKDEDYPENTGHDRKNRLQDEVFVYSHIVLIATMGIGMYERIYFSIGIPVFICLLKKCGIKRKKISRSVLIR